MHDDLPALPVPNAHRVEWMPDEVGYGDWSQYHDESDPLPVKWDQPPPDMVTALFTADQMRAYALAARAQALEAAALACEAEALESNEQDGDRGYNIAVKHCSAAIRSMITPPHGDKEKTP